MTISAQALGILCPMHLILSGEGKILQAGPTLAKLCAGAELAGALFFNFFEVYRPRAIDCMDHLLAVTGRKVHLRMRQGRRVGLKGVVVPDGNGGAVINLSFGIGVIDAVRDFNLTASDFAPTDLAIEMLYLVEAKSAAMDASRRLNSRLEGAKIAAEQRAFTDTLTGLGNRRAMDKALSRIMARGTPFSLMHLDLDFFKQVNDTLGHAAGDHVLQSAARSMLELTRKDDTVARVGGDEFIIICPELTSADRLASLAQRLIDRIERPVYYQNQRCEISVSIGINKVPSTHADIETILEQTDSALYAAKRAGRAQYRFYLQEGENAATEKTSKAPAE